MATGKLNLDWARRIVGALAESGVEEAEVAPGSRSAPLVLALHHFAGLRVRVHLDERSAGFFALGYGRCARRPAVVVTTSGTAVANLLPSVVEAAASDVPMILLTADRPPRLRGADANQTIDQVGIFGQRLRDEADLPVPSECGLDAVAETARNAVASAHGPPGGPVHLNVPFDKPLQPNSPEPWRRGLPKGRRTVESAAAPLAWFERNPVERDAAAAARHDRESTQFGVDLVACSEHESVQSGAALVARRLAEARRPIVVAGPSSEPDADGPALAEFSAQLNVPLLADPLSGARFAFHTSSSARPIGAYDHFLRVPAVVERLEPDLVLRTGRTPTSSVLEAALERWGAARHVVVDAGSQPKDHQRLADEYVNAPARDVLVAEGGRATVRSSWAGTWEAVEAAAWAAVDTALDDAANEGAYAAALLAALPAGATLFVSSSMPVRDVDAYGRPAPRGIRILGNRGASGIDGIVSSTLGCAAAGNEPVVGLVGDLALFHDLNGLLAAREPDLNVVLVVIDNDGGGIFHMLPIRAFEPAFTPCFVTPHGLDVGQAAQLYGIPFADASNPAELRGAVRAAVARSGTEIVRLRTCAGTNRLRHEAVRRRVAERVSEVLSCAAPLRSRAGPAPSRGL